MLWKSYIVYKCYLSMYTVDEIFILQGEELDPTDSDPDPDKSDAVNR